MTRSVLIIALAFTLVSCGGGGGSSSPASPTPVTPAPSPVPTTFALVGNVTESAPSTNVPLVGARVTVMDCANAGKSATTDGSGNYRIEGLSGGMTFRSSMSGYQEVERSVGMDQNRSRAFPLRPIPANLAEDSTGNISGGDVTTCSDGIFTKPCRVIALAVHNDGPLIASLDWNPGAADLDLTLWRGSSLIASSRAAVSKEFVSSNLSGDSCTRST